jgi:hypothetical protein
VPVEERINFGGKFQRGKLKIKRGDLICVSQKNASRTTKTYKFLIENGPQHNSDGG